MSIRREFSPVNRNSTIDMSEFRSVKMEKSAKRTGEETRRDSLQSPIPKRCRSDRARRCGGGGQDEPEAQQSSVDRRVLRSYYTAVKHTINEEKEEICRGGSDKFQKIIREVDRLHQHVIKPREQVADAETLLEMADTLVTSVKSYSKEGLTPSLFISSLLREFGVGRRRSDDDLASIRWNALGSLVSSIFKKGCGCSTMIGPMKSELKQRKVSVYRRRKKLTEKAARPEQLGDNLTGEKTDTGKNMATMFNVLRKQKSLRLEQLIFNRFSFAQTVENLFTLSFLVKDGRANIAVDENGTHLVSPKNAPCAGEAAYHHFVFRFDFQDWQLMKESVQQGEEQMPHRYQVSIPLSKTDVSPVLSQVAIPI